MFFHFIRIVRRQTIDFFLRKHPNIVPWKAFISACSKAAYPLPKYPVPISIIHSICKVSLAFSRVEFRKHVFRFTADGQADRISGWVVKTFMQQICFLDSSDYIDCHALVRNRDFWDVRQLCNRLKGNIPSTVTIGIRNFCCLKCNHGTGVWIFGNHACSVSVASVSGFIIVFRPIERTHCATKGSY